MYSLLGLLVIFIVTVTALNTRILAVVDSPTILETHSKLFDHLQQRGYDVSFAVGRSNQVKLHDYGVYDYDHVILLSKGGRVAVSTEELEKFLDSGRNVFVAVGSNPGRVPRKFAQVCGIQFDDADSSVYDFFNYDSDLEAIRTSAWNTKVVQAVVGQSVPVLYKGIGMELDDSSSVVFPILSAEETGYASTDSSRAFNGVLSTGVDTILAAGIRTRNNARAVFLGSLDMISDSFIESSENNLLVSTALIDWTLQVRSKLRIASVSHFKESNSVDLNPSTYRVRDEVRYQIRLEEYDGLRDKWVPFNVDDVQLELVMLDPHIRTSLTNDGDGNYEVLVALPGHFGIYKFEVVYNRHGYSMISDSQAIPVHPFWHNDYERFLPCAYPYYAGAFSMMGGFLVFSLAFLFTK